jgi:hypothetical protein
VSRFDPAVCFRCGKMASQIPEYREPAKEEDITADEWMRENEGTYNAETNTFACTECYMAIGMPSAPGGGWKAPEHEAQP